MDEPSCKAFLFISRLTSRGVRYELVVELWDQYDEYAVAHYDNFWLEKNTTNDNNDPGRSTEFPIPSFIEVFWLSFRESPRLVGRYCS